MNGRVESEKQASGLLQIKSLEKGLDECKQGLSRLDGYRDLMLQNIEAVKRWQTSFSEPLEHFPGGKELIEETDIETRKAFAEADRMYEKARSEYLNRQKVLEGELEAKKKQLVSKNEKQEEGGDS